MQKRGTKSSKRSPTNQNSPYANASLGMALYYVAGHTKEGFRYYQQAIALNEDHRNEDSLRSEHMWGGKAINDSRPLRGTGALAEGLQAVARIIERPARMDDDCRNRPSAHA